MLQDPDVEEIDRWARGSTQRLQEPVVDLGHTSYRHGSEAWSAPMRRAGATRQEPGESLPKMGTLETTSKTPTSGIASGTSEATSVDRSSIFETPSDANEALVVRIAIVLRKFSGSEREEVSFEVAERCTTFAGASRFVGVVIL